jgi:regulatory protein
MKITNIKQQVKRADRYSIFVDGAYAFSLSESALLELGLASGQELDPSRLKDLQKAAGSDKAYGNALRYAVLRPRSEWEIVTYLNRKGVEEPVAAVIRERLSRLGLVDDAAFARAWVANRRLLKNTSKRRLKMELKLKHVPEAIIAAALAEDTVSEQDSLRQLIAKKQARYPDRMKFMQYLARQGFGYDDIKTALGEAEIT